jgi:hypothetical protein
MRNRRFAVPGLAAAAVIFAGACSDNTPTEPPPVDTDAALFGRLARTSQNVEGTLDAHLARVAERVPGFGGMYYGEDGALIVVMAGKNQPQSVTALRQALGAELRATGLDLAAQPVRVVPGRYNFAQLHTMHQAAVGLLSAARVVFTDADERANRVTIGVEDAATASAVENQIAMLNLPRDAFQIRVVEPVTPMQTLRDRRRPLAGGLQINFPGFLCTLGFNVRSPGQPQAQGFVTNSHCSNNQWDNAAGNTPYWQPLGSVAGPADPNWIGTEAFDAPGFTGGNCPVGRLCRNSDAAGVRYAPGVENSFGQIFRTGQRNSLTIELIFSHWNIISERAGNGLVGDEIHKVGRTTGWTWGNISNSCVNTNVGGTNFTVFCQDWVTGPTNTVGGGDSGSATFRPIDRGNPWYEAELVGILWGGSGSTIFVYSPMTQVRADNPPPAGAANWITYPGQTPP